MRDLAIAYGNSRKSRLWSNKITTFDALCERLKTPIRTTESAEEYAKMPKSQRDEIKDKGGFVAGHLAKNRRLRENVTARSMLVFDLDEAKRDFLTGIKAHIPYGGCYYSTHSHTPESPRIRIILPCSRDMLVEEFNAVARYIAAEIGIDMVDACSYVPHQLMYWPTVSSNGEYLFGVLEGMWLNPDVILAAHPNWRDCSLLPTSSKESIVREHSGKKQQDPLTKSGMVGAFCNVYTIQDAIEKFLSDVYKPSNTPGRYDYIKGKTTGGLAVYDDKFAYSHHATDPASGMELNAFDLVRVHLFPDDDDKKSFNKMADFVNRDTDVKIYLSKKRLEEAGQEFDEGNSWQANLTYMPRSQVLENSVRNELLILKNDPDFANFAFNEMASRVQITGEVPWKRPKDNVFWRDADTAQLKAILDVRYVPFSNRNHDVSFTTVVEDRRFHPVKDYFASLPEWDGVPRVETLLIDYFGADDNSYTRAVTRKTLIAAVARIYEPGIKFDSALILVGAQGIGKSTFFSKLAGKWFSDSLSLAEMKDKAGAEKLQGYLILELGEMSGMKKVDIETVKSFLSRTDDIYRPSYGRVVESHPRQCIIVGSTNFDTGFLRDITGNRKFWPVNVSSTSAKNSWDMTEDDVTQIWAESICLYNRREKLYLEGRDAKIAEEMQRNAMETDERQGIVEDYLNTLLPENWDSMNMYERRNYLTGDDFGSPQTGTVARTQVSNVEIWCECFGNALAGIKPADSYAIAAIMMKIPGWKKSGKRKKLHLYGQQRLYQKLSSS